MKRFLPAAMIASALLAGSFSVVRAADAPQTLGLTVSPPSFELSANPGDTIDNSIRITNNSPDAVTFEVTVQDFIVQGTEGSVTVTSDDNPGAFSKFFRFPQTQFHLNSGQGVEVPFSIVLPKTAEPGGQFASVLFQPKVVSSTSQTGAKVVQRVGSLILMKVSGNIKEDGRILSFKPKTYVGQWDEVTASDGKTKILVAKDEKLGDEKSQKFFNNGPIAFDLLVKNNGNVHFKPAGTVTIYNLFGQKVDQLALDPHNVFPGGERRTTVIWSKKTFWGGYYRAQVAAVYGSKNEVLTAETWLWAFPTGAAIIILVLLVVIILARRRLWRAIRILAKGR
ncbi:MAG TPA: hypothetical protein VLF41_01990 [Candidatus Nanoarchaeia archaeon]|nr:hypothetical protein [Candidatus Nanoarchaeia archaeon]